MPDIVTPEVRSRMMSGIRGTNTKPELLLRRGLHSRGFRFRLHDRKLPGCPDIVFPRFRAVLFAHGCFWHGHDCNLFRWPATRAEFWKNKIERNRINDARAKALLGANGWRQAVVWECALRGSTKRDFPEILSACSDWLRSHEAALEIRGKLQ